MGPEAGGALRRVDALPGVDEVFFALSDPTRREGRETHYTLTPAPLVDAMGWMAEVGADWDKRLARLAERAAG